MSDIIESLRALTVNDATTSTLAVCEVAAREIERMKEWQAKVLAAANCEGERIFQLGEDLTAAEQRVAELEAEIERLRAKVAAVERCPDCCGEMSHCGAMTFDGPMLDCRVCQLTAEVELLRDALHYYANKEYDSRSMSDSVIQYVADEVLSQPRREV